MSDGKVVYDITGNNGPFKNAVSESQGIAQEGANSIVGIAGKAASAFTAIASAAVVKGLVDLGKASVEAYADYEQLTGGVETLFKKSADTIKGYAAEAYKTAGLSANQYMEQVTGFSASMIQSLGGDTARAAEYSNQAVIDMADNANKMGSSMESIQNAYQGFAKGNFTMLDNLKLGYGGTREEMQRLLEDAQKLTGIHYDISSFADITQAIHAVQTEMGITGTTAEEAASTISGSLNMVKASWENLLTGMSDPDADIDGLINNFIESFLTATENIVPKVTEFITKLVDALTRPETLYLLLKAGAKILAALLKGIFEAGKALSENALELVEMFFEGIGEALDKLWDSIKEIGGNIINGLIEGIKEKGKALVDSVVDTVKEAWQAAKDFLGIASPSKEFRIIGRYIDEGLTAGIDDLSGLPADATTEMVGKLTAGAQIALAADSARTASMASGVADISNAVQSAGFQDVADGPYIINMTVDGERWAQLFLPYLDRNRHNIGPNVMEGTSWT